MDSYSRNVERLQRMLQECDVLSDAEDDSEGESDFVIENEVYYKKMSIGNHS